MKRALDITASLALLLLLSPLLLVISVLVRIFVGPPVFFRQERPGLGAKLFRIVKFRTLSDERDAQGRLLPDAARLGRFGRILRSTSLDELPELWNVLKGEMSLVGPRPLLTDYMALYDARQATRHLVKPGMTGWAQINGRNALSWEERLEMDVWYVEHRSFSRDLQILLTTVPRVFFRHGITASGEATMTPFRGNRASGQ
jgi:lipopolysaccharide/colanic/teichoic acid biosynthesis glycosyltransferase